MKLSELFPQFKDSQIEISSVTQDTRNVKPGSLFIAIKGTKLDGHDYLKEAIQAGAVALVVQDVSKVPSDFNIPVQVVQDSRLALDQIASQFYDHPSRKLFCFGVTGTNGKTSITYMLEWILAEIKIPCGVLGTINHHLGEKVWPSEMTTPDSVALQSRLAEMKEAGARAVAMEVSSHALDQRRADSVEFNTAIFTNLTRDHLDYHSSMDDYFAAKQRLFTDLLWKTVKDPHFAIVNTDDPWGARMKVAGSAVLWSFGANTLADFSYQVTSVDFTQTKFSLKTPFGSFKSFIPMCGDHNVANAVAVIAAAASSGATVDRALDVLTKFPGVPGRLQMVPNEKSLYVFVDYAHTPDALENVLQSLNKVRANSKSSSRIWTVFGCGGDRDKGKRPLMAQIAAQLSDFVMVTSDNPRTENPDAIITDILQGIDSSKKEKVFSEVHRKLALEKVFKQAAAHDVILIAGKGHEDYQIIGKEKLHFSDFETAKELLS